MGFNPHAPRKPFITRGSRIQRCEHCYLGKSLCICPYKSVTQPNAVFWLLTHHNEQYKPTNTGRLILDTVENSKTFIWSRTQLDFELEVLLKSSEYYPVIVFPAEELHQDRMMSAKEVREQAELKGKMPAFLVLDGTWRQARRMFRLSQYLQHLPVVEPSYVQSSQYLLRKSASDEHLCTAEAAALLLNDIGEPLAAETLKAYFDVFNAHYRESKTAGTGVMEAVQGAKEFLRAKLGG